MKLINTLSFFFIVSLFLAGAGLAEDQLLKSHQVYQVQSESKDLSWKVNYKATFDAFSSDLGAEVEALIKGDHSRKLRGGGGERNLVYTGRCQQIQGQTIADPSGMFRCSDACGTGYDLYYAWARVDTVIGTFYGHACLITGCTEAFDCSNYFYRNPPFNGICELCN